MALKSMRGAPRRPTLEEVGAVAGVSRATVSRVVNGSPKASPAVRAEVERAIARLGYVPNRAARTLVTRRTDTIALVVSEPEARVFGDPFFAALVRGIGAAVSMKDLQLVLVMAQGTREHEKVERYVRQGHVDGVVLMSLHGEDPLPGAFVEAGIPTVLVGRPKGDPVVPFVDADNRGGARLAVQFLIARRRRRIATITGPLDMCVGVDRFEGYRDALTAAHIPQRKGLVQGGDFTEEAGHVALTRLLEKNPDIDGVFVASDLMAAGALQALRAAGRRVPQDVAVVGFDDAPLARHTSPALTTIRQPLDEMVAQTSEMLFRQVAGASRTEHVIVPTSLIKRKSA